MDADDNPLVKIYDLSKCWVVISVTL